MEIKAQGTLNYETVKASLHVTIYKKTKPKKAVALRLLFTALAMAFCIFNMVAFGFSSYMLLSFFAMLLGGFIFIYMYFLLPKIRFKAMGKMQNVTNNYVFTDNAIICSSSTDGYEGKAEVNYSVICKVIETSQYMLIYQTSNNFYVLEKATVSGGSVDDLRRKLFCLLGENYVIYNY